MATTAVSASLATNPNSNGVTGPAAAAWPHTDRELMSESGLSYDVTYCGSVEVLRPMKDLDFQSRTVLARECIERIYGALNPTIPPKKRSNSSSSLQHLTQFVGTMPNVVNGNTPVTVSVNIDRLLISHRTTGEILGCFQLSLVSFASKGDDDVSTCVAFVAKDADQGRACHVLMAPAISIAKELIGTLGQAFDLKFSRLVAQRNRLLQNAPDFLQGPQQSTSTLAVEPPVHISSTNVTPNNVKPFVTVPPAVQTPPDTFSREYVNDSVGSGPGMVSPTPSAPAPLPPPHAAAPIINSENSSNESSSPVKTQQKQGVFGQPWFHGFIDREESESRLKCFGDFLIRESARNPGQFVLSGRTEFCGVKHLLLMDPEGSVRTKDRQFLSVAHLVQHHLSSGTPIISQEIEIFLRHPVKQ